MASLLTHPAVPIGLAIGLGRSRVPPRLVLAGVVCSLLPDADSVGFVLGIPYQHPLGHRGLAHSLAFAVLVGVVGALVSGRLGARRWPAALFLGVCTASHGFLDALTDGGLGVAFWAPFDNTRYFLPWRVLTVSPIGISRFVSSWGARVLASELRWVWLPCLAFGAAGWALRRRVAGRARRSGPAA